MPLEEDFWIKREKVVPQVASSLHLWEKEHCRFSGSCEFAPSLQKLWWLWGAAGTGCRRCGQSHHEPQGGAWCPSSSGASTQNKCRAQLSP